MPRVSERYRDTRRRQVIEGARRCFARAGFHGTSMQDVFAESGLSSGAVYGYFASKDDLITAIVEEVLAEIFAALDPLTDTDPLPPPHDVLARVLRVLDRPPHGAELARLAVQVWAEAGHNAELRERLAGHYREMRHRLTALVQRYQRNGTLDPWMRADEVAQVLTAMGPAFLSQRALLADVDADTFIRGLQGLLGRS